MSALFPFAVGSGCGFALAALRTDVTSDATPELPGLVEFDGAAPSMEPLAATSLFVPLRTVKGEDGPAPRVVATSLTLTDVGAKPR